MIYILFFLLVIAYLIFFQLDTVGFKLLRGFINSIQLTRIHQVGIFLIGEKYKTKHEEKRGKISFAG